MLKAVIASDEKTSIGKDHESEANIASGRLVPYSTDFKTVQPIEL